jgi:hypothetical protein
MGINISFLFSDTRPGNLFIILTGLESVRYGWMTSDVPDMKRHCQTVRTWAGALITVPTSKTSPFSVVGFRIMSVS